MQICRDILIRVWWYPDVFPVPVLFLGPIFSGTSTGTFFPGPIFSGIDTSTTQKVENSREFSGTSTKFAGIFRYRYQIFPVLIPVPFQGNKFFRYRFLYFLFNHMILTFSLTKINNALLSKNVASRISVLLLDKFAKVPGMVDGGSNQFWQYQNFGTIWTPITSLTGYFC